VTVPRVVELGSTTARYVPAAGSSIVSRNTLVRPQQAIDDPRLVPAAVSRRR
jgi:hypothetical protein